MKQGKILRVIGVIAAAVIIGVFLIQFSLTSENKQSQDIELQIIDVDNDGIPDDQDPFIAAPRDWPTSGPFQIDRTQYVIGELVLIRVGELEPNEKGQISFLRPLNSTHQKVYLTIPFDGSQKSHFNQYFKPSLSRAQKTCEKADLLGNWTVVFQGTNYENISFEIVDRYIPGEEKYYKEIDC